MAAAQPRTVELPPLSVRAEVVAKSINDETRTVDLIFSTGAAVDRMDFWTGKRYMETLSLEPEHIRLDRLNSGAPLLDSHSAWSVSDQLGAVVPGSVTLTKTEARAQARFSKRDSVNEVWQDVRDGIINSVSVGYRVYKFEETEEKDKVPVRRAVDWEPYEISMVSMPADAGAKVRGEKPPNSNPCQIVTRGASKETTMRDDERPETSAEVPQNPPVLSTDDPPDNDGRAEAIATERARAQGIIAACRVAMLPQSFADKLIESGKPYDECARLVFVEMGKRGQGTRGPSAIPPSDPVVGADPLEKQLRGIENALLHRSAPDLKDQKGEPCFKLSDEGREYRGMSLLDIARQILNARGVRTTSMDKRALAGAALGLETRAGYHTTSDFAILLADVQSKVLRAAYGEAPQTWMPLARRVVLPDFKTNKQLQLGEAPTLLEVLEHGEFTRGTIAEGKEEFTLKTYGRVFAITRQALINDDTDAFARVPAEFGRSARRKESDLAWAQITSNPVMGDAQVLFHADHDNLAGAAAAIDIGPLGIGRAALRMQTGLDGTSVLNLTPRYLIVPAGKETIADQFVSVITPAAAGSVNPFQGRLTVISEPRLDANSSTAWYLAASPDQIDILLHGVLEGNEGPAIDTRVGFDIDGIEIKCRLDVAFKVADWRGLFKNAGA